MSQPNVPAGVFELKLGDSFAEKLHSTSKSYQTIRYDFKPANASETYLQYGEGKEMAVVVAKAGEAGGVGGEEFDLYKGPAKEAKEKECLLIFDHNTSTFTIDRLDAVLSLKKQRDDPETRAAIAEQIRKQRGLVDATLESEGAAEEGEARGGDPALEGGLEGVVVGASSSSSSDNSSAEESSSEDEEDPAPPVHIEQQKHSPVKAASPKKKKDTLLHDDLRLSESSDDD